MPYLVYPVRPMQHGIATDSPDLFLQYGSASWPTKNVRIDQNSVKKRWGYGTADRNLGSGVEVQKILIFQTLSGTRMTLYLTPANLCMKESAGTWSYKTETYTTGTVTDITGAVVTGDSTAWNTSGLAAGDKFVLDTDHTANSEEDASWAEILTVDGATQITLTASYGGTTGAMSATYKGRKVYTTPSNERWTYAIVNDKFCFGNGNTDTQYYAGSDYAAPLDSTNAIKARYMIEYANRLILADYGTTRNPLGIFVSENEDPTGWDVATTAAQYDFLETEDFITGLGKIGTDLVIYKRNGIIFGSRTGISTDPLQFPVEKRGVGCEAPYSIVEFMGTNAFVGKKDFYVIDGDHPSPIGERIRHRFFDIVGETELSKVWGFNNFDQDAIVWVANTSEGKLAFAWNWKTTEWAVYEYAHDIASGGKGVI